MPARRRQPALLAVLAALTALGAGSVAADAAPRDDTLEGRAILPVEQRGQGSSPAPAPFPKQPVGGFSALLDAGRGTFWAMPDNGYGSKANSADFLLRVYRVRVTYERARRGPEDGRVDVLNFVQLRDPDDRIPFPIVTEGSRERLLTGSDFDPESMRIARDGTFYFGDEFGPFLLHTDRTGKVLEAPIATPGVRAPENESSEPPAPVNLRSSSGFEGMAISTDKRFLYPSLERATNEEPDKTRHPIFQFDLRRGRYTGRRFIYRADAPVPPEQEHVVGDMTALDNHRLLVIERDFLQGAAARFEKVFLVDLRRTDATGALVKREVLDLLDIRDPALISLPGRPGDFGLGDPFKFPYITTESVLPVGGNRLAIVNDNNFGSVGGRHPSLPDYTDFIEVGVPDLRGGTDRGAKRNK